MECLIALLNRTRLWRSNGCTLLRKVAQLCQTRPWNTQWIYPFISRAIHCHQCLVDSPTNNSGAGLILFRGSSHIHPAAIKLMKKEMRLARAIIGFPPPYVLWCLSVQTLSGGAVVAMHVNNLPDENGSHLWSRLEDFQNFVFALLSKGNGAESTEEGAKGRRIIAQQHPVTAEAKHRTLGVLIRAGTIHRWISLYSIQPIYLRQVVNQTIPL